MSKVTMWRSRWRCVIKPAYSVSFLLSINLFVWQNVLYIPNDRRTKNIVDCDDTHIYHLACSCYVWRTEPDNKHKIDIKRQVKVLHFCCLPQEKTRNMTKRNLLLAGSISIHQPKYANLLSGRNTGILAASLHLTWWNSEFQTNIII